MMQFEVGEKIEHRLRERLETGGYTQSPTLPGSSAFATASARLLVVLFDDRSVRVAAFDNQRCHRWTVRFSPNVGAALIGAFLDAAEQETREMGAGRVESGDR